MPRNPAQGAARAADQVSAWLQNRTRTDAASRPRPALAGPEMAESRDTAHAEAAVSPKSRSAPAHGQKIAPAHTDWLYHHLAVMGPAEEVGAFRNAAAGAGVIPWTIDLDCMEDDFFLCLMAPASGQKRTLSLEGARMLAAELREAVGRRHALAVARVGRSRACPFDLHALLPVPQSVLLLGPDHPEAIDWLWTHWGTTDALRHVVGRPAPGGRDEALRVTFWAADWTPWRALEKVRADWPAVRFDVRPIYDKT